MSQLIDNRKEADAHLVGLGQQLEAEKKSNVQTFIMHKLDDERVFYKPDADQDCAKPWWVL